MGFTLKSIILLSCASFASGEHDSGSGPYTNFLRKIQTHSVAPRVVRTPATMGFHSLREAFISAYVWQKLNRYKAFFSSRDRFFQSPFSFSRSFSISAVGSL
uniref:Putative secreted protein n=1 Tax=Ixodes ricinus TaxID=34613 RepID=A0A6B0UIE2_IXORI